MSTYFYPRSPCGERQENYMDGYKIVYISIHALLAESDMKEPTNTRALEFLSTLSLRRATLWGLMGGSNYDDFYPRSPCGERLQLDVMITTFYYFYPRSPCGERQGYH